MTELFSSSCECHVRGSMGDQSTVSFMSTSARLPWVASSWDSAVVGFELRPQGIQNEALTTKPQWLRFSQFQVGSSLTGTDWLQQTWTGPSNSCDIDGAGLLWPGAVIEVKHFKSETVKNKFIGVCKWCDAVVWMLCIWFLSITPHPYSSSQFSFLCIPPLVSCPNFHFVYPTLSLMAQCWTRVYYP